LGYIKLYNVQFSPASSIDQTVRVEYRVGGSVGSFILVNNAAPVLANGNFNPIVTLNNLTDSETYTVRITSLCNGSVTTQNFTAGEQCTLYILQADVGGTTIEWTECRTGIIKQAFVAANDQISICIKTVDGYRALFGNIILVSNAGNCGT